MLIDLWDFQKAFVSDRSRFIVAMWARGCGKSAMSGLKIVLDVFENEANRTPSDWLIVSASKEQAQEALGKVAEWARAFYRIARDLKIITEEVEEKTEDGLQRYTRYTLRLGKRSRVMAIAAAPKAIRGYTANIWWDEACFFEDDGEMWKALQPCLRGRLKAIVTSTPMGGDEKLFYRFVHDETLIQGKPLWSKHICDIFEAVEQGRPFDIEIERAAMEADAWAQEMELQWIDNASTWFPIELITAAEDERASTIGAAYQGGKCFIGNDIGLRGDRWVAWVLERVGEELITREVVVLPKTSTFEQHDKVIARLFKDYPIARYCIDQGGIGERTTEEMTKLYGTRVEGVIFNPDNKGAMAVLGKQLMQSGRLRLPDDRDIRRDLRRLQKTTSAAGAVRFDAIRDKHGHADRCWAMLLACNAAITPVVPIEFQSERKIDEMADWLRRR